MPRDAIINPHTLGTIEAYRYVILRLSDILGDPALDMEKLFYAVVIQSGIERFRIPEGGRGQIPDSDFLGRRVARLRYDSIEDTLRDLRQHIERGTKESVSKDDRSLVDGLVFFLTDLYAAAKFKRPVATAVSLPQGEDLQRVLRDDLLLVVEALLSSVRVVSLEAPVLSLEVPKKDLGAFRKVLESDLFHPYAESHALLESASRSEGVALDRVGENARKLVDAFPMSLDLRRTGMGILQALPAIVDTLAGKVLGSFAKPLISALEESLGRARRLLLYSFDPVWQQVMERKMNKVRIVVEAERAGRALPET